MRRSGRAELSRLSERQSQADEETVPHLFEGEVGAKVVQDPAFGHGDKSGVRNGTGVVSCYRPPPSISRPLRWLPPSTR